MQSLDPVDEKTLVFDVLGCQELVHVFLAIMQMVQVALAFGGIWITCDAVLYVIL